MKNSNCPPAPDADAVRLRPSFDNAATGEAMNSP